MIYHSSQEENNKTTLNPIGEPSLFDDCDDIKIKVDVESHSRAVMHAGVAASRGGAL